MAKPLKVCVCGGGKSAHVITALAASNPDMEVSVLTMYKDEAEMWTKAIEKDDMVLTIHGSNGVSRDVKAKPAQISKEAKDVVPGSDMVLFTVAAFAHEEYMKAIAGLIDKKTVLIGFPGQAGFEYLCKSYLSDELREQVTVMSFEMSPWVCEVTEYGKKVEVTRTSKSLDGSILRGKAIPRKPALMSLQMVVGNVPMLKQVRHFLEVLFTSYSFMHPAIMYGRWKDWDGKYMDTEPLFYEGVDESTADLIESCSKEYQSVAHAITGQKPEIDLTELPDIINWILKFYEGEIEDGSSLLKAITTNSVYKGVKHIMQKDRSKFKPDLTCRYLSEDIPCGMLVVKGIAEILGVETPSCDMLIGWGQEKLKKNYLVDGKVTGEHVKETRAPQRFGFTSLEEILSGKKSEC
ncbi:OCDH-like protein [Mya arenaria]|uniref:OCDH-like protein n=1 Tax=Mya arenaria TaxID=6604 RepID=A0ABY7FLX5_MYAAR|nr:octopine dehydrogenase-like [Mya arenaria]WAR23137.1 OCDH-like protein [Mya arenaria]